MKIAEVHPQVSPEIEQCDMCVQEGLPSIIPPFTDYRFVTTTEGVRLNLCDDHYYQVATLQ